MPHVDEDGSLSLLFDEPPDSNSVLREACSKRKRGFFPYTENEEDITPKIDARPSPHSVQKIRPLDDSVPWYQWKRKGFAAPEERVKRLIVPKSDTESEDEFWHAREPERQKEGPNLRPMTNESNYRQCPVEGDNTCQICTCIKDGSVIEQARKFRSSCPSSKFEAGLQICVNCVYSLSDRLTSDYRKIKRGINTS